MAGPDSKKELQQQPDNRQLRQQLRSHRLRLSATEQQVASERMSVALEKLLVNVRGPIASYFTDDGEIDPLPCMQKLYARGIDIYLPWVADNDAIQFLLWKPNEPLIVGRWGIMHPCPQKSTTLSDLHSLSHILLPLVAFDGQGNRLGRGGGFYDKLLHDCSTETRRIALAHHFQQVEKLATNPWDQKVQYAVTDKGTLSF